MVSSRMFLIGLVMLFFGVQLRMVKTYELNARASQFLEERMAKSDASTSMVAYDDGYLDDFLSAMPSPTGPKLRSITPPPWLGWSLISVGAVLILTCPCYKGA